MSFFTPFAFYNTPVGFDPDAQAFITATGISGSNATAINTLVLNLKSYSIWTKLQAAYPLIGGTANSNKYNLMNPVDTDAGFRLTFSGGVTHDANGITFNGTNGYATTFFTPSTNYASADSAHISIYNRTAAKTSGFFLAARTIAGSKYCAIQFDPTRQNYTSVNSTETLQGSYTTLQGFILATRSSSTTESHYLNSSLVTTVTRNSNSFTNNALTLGARNQATPASPQAATYTAYNCAFATIGTGLNGTEETNLYNSIQTYQTSLGRQV